MKFENNKDNYVYTMEEYMYANIMMTVLTSYQESYIPISLMAELVTVPSATIAVLVSVVAGLLSISFISQRVKYILSWDTIYTW